MTKQGTDNPIICAPATSLGALAERTPAHRNRAVDAYRALAMVCVALGHTLAATLVREPDGEITADNALAYSPAMHWLTLLFQVMPLFFCLGGYSNAASLDAHLRNGGHRADWVAARLRRLTKPTGWLAGVWLAIITVAVTTGAGRGLVFVAAAGAAIPLWFLANYVADTALAPLTLRLHRANPRRFALAAFSAFCAIEACHVAGVPYIAKANIVPGWMLFQVLGFWWRDGLLPSTRRLRSIAVLSAVACAALIAFGPWPLAMVRFPGQALTNTWPPTVALLAYGVAYTLAAIAIAPVVNDALTRRTRLWTVIAGANTMTMTVYLWHFTAITIVLGAMRAVGFVGHDAVGSTQWWLLRIPMVLATAIVLIALVALFARKERDGMLAAATARSHSTLEVAALSVAVAAGFEVWTIADANPVLTMAGITGLLTTRWHLHRGSSIAPPDGIL